MKSQAEKITSPVYFYKFAYKGTFSTTFNFNVDEILGTNRKYASPIRCVYTFRYFEWSSFQN